MSKEIEVTCSAPYCKATVKTTKMELFMMKLKSLFHGGDFSAMLFCPEHEERITAGRKSDGDPNTNPDLNK